MANQQKIGHLVPETRCWHYRWKRYGVWMHVVSSTFGFV